MLVANGTKVCNGRTSSVLAYAGDRVRSHPVLSGTPVSYPTIRAVHSRLISGVVEVLIVVYLRHLKVFTVQLGTLTHSLNITLLV